MCTKGKKSGPLFVSVCAWGGSFQNQISKFLPFYFPNASVVSMDIWNSIVYVLLMLAPFRKNCVCFLSLNCWVRRMRCLKAHLQGLECLNMYFGGTHVLRICSGSTLPALLHSLMHPHVAI